MLRLNTCHARSSMSVSRTIPTLRWCMPARQSTFIQRCKVTTNTSSSNIINGNTTASSRNGAGVVAGGNNHTTLFALRAQRNRAFSSRLRHPTTSKPTSKARGSSSSSPSTSSVSRLLSVSSSTPLLSQTFQNHGRCRPYATRTDANVVAADTTSENEDLEVKDAEVIFQTVMSELESKYGRENIKFPKEIIWLMGAPGSGKGTHTPFIMRVRGITAPPIVMSDILQLDECEEIKRRGDMVPDRLVLRILLELLIDRNRYKNGVVVDGFPRTAFQVEFLEKLKAYMTSLRQSYAGSEEYCRPAFRVCVLFVPEKVSIERQMERALTLLRQRQINALESASLFEEGNIIQRNMIQRNLMEETDLSEPHARNRYAIFKKHYDTLQKLREHFVFTIVDARGRVHEVEQAIEKEFKYQSSMELDSDTFESIHLLPLVSELLHHARQELIGRLDGYQMNDTERFKEVVSFIDHEIVPSLHRHTLSGFAIVRTVDSLFTKEPERVTMVVDILSERGFYVSYDHTTDHLPTKVDPTTGEVTLRPLKTHKFNIKFKTRKLREFDDDAEAITSSS